MSKNNFATEAGRMSDRQIVCQMEKKDDTSLINFVSQKRKESLKQQSHALRTFEQLSEKKLPSIYNGSATLETLEHQSQFEEKGLLDYLRQRVAQLQQQIAMLHSSYIARIEQITLQNSDKSDVYLNLIDQIHNKHRTQKQEFTRRIQEFEQERSQISTIEDKMNFINSGIEDILKESAELNNQNKELLKAIEEREDIIQEQEEIIRKKDEAIRENQKLMDSIDTELHTCKLKVKQYEAELKSQQDFKKWWMNLQKEIIEMIDAARSEINLASPSESSLSSKIQSSVCSMTKLERSVCNHCRINKIQSKLTKTLHKK